MCLSLSKKDDTEELSEILEENKKIAEDQRKIIELLKTELEKRGTDI